MAIKFPEGHDEASFLKEARELFQMDVDADLKNRQQALDDLKFAADYNGAQWDDLVRQQRMSMGRPCLTNNVLPQYIGQVIGDSRINQPSIKVRPAEDADEDLAEVRAGTIRSIENQSNAKGIYANAGQSQVTCGVGYFSCGLKYADDETFNTDLEIKMIPDPMSVVFDCMSVERTGKDARRCFVSDEMSRKDFEKQWPGKVPSDLGTMEDDVRAGGWVTRDTVRVTAYYMMVDQKRTIALMPDGKTIDITDGEPAEKPVKTRDVVRKRCQMYLITGVSVLEGPFDIPIDRVPIFRAFGQIYYVGNDRVWFGLVRFMKDQQRLLNYADSLTAEALALAPKAQWVGPESAFDGKKEEFRNAHRSGDPVLTYSDGAEIAPQRVDPPQFPVAVLTWRQTLTQTMKDVTGLHDASLGIQSNETSGKAILARQREGDIATVIYHDNLNAAIAECGRVLNQLIPIVYDTARTIRVLGEDDAQKVIRVNDPQDPEAIDLTQGKYDIVVETGPSYSTKRVEAAESMLAFVQAVPAAAAVTGDLIAKAQDWPLAQEIGDRLQKMLPPGIVEKPLEDMTPEEQQAAQQAQMAAQQQAQKQEAIQDAMIQAELQLKQAQAMQAEANAQKAMADAQKALREATEQPQGEPVEMILAQLAEATAKAEAAAANAEAARAKAVEAWAKAEMTVANAQSASVDAEFNHLDKQSIVSNGRGLADPEPAANGNAGAR